MGDFRCPNFATVQMCAFVLMISAFFAWASQTFASQEEGERGWVLEPPLDVSIANLCEYTDTLILMRDSEDFSIICSIGLRDYVQALANALFQKTRAWPWRIYDNFFFQSAKALNKLRTFVVNITVATSLNDPIVNTVDPLETEKDFLRQKSELAHAVRVQHGGGSGKEVDDVDVACIEEACAAEKEECMLDVRKSFRLCLW
jgi:hypothetical protein